MSRVLNGKAGVSDNTREAVLTALDVLGYERPTQLRGQRARLIGLVLPDTRHARAAPTLYASRHFVCRVTRLCPTGPMRHEK